MAGNGPWLDEREQAAWFVDALTPAQLDAVAAISASVMNRLAEHRAGVPSGKETPS